MQLSTTSAQAAIAPELKPWSRLSPAQHSGVQVGSANIQWGLGECEIWNSNNLLRTGRPVGAADGYATLQEATTKLGELTHLNKGNAALVIREGDRFFGRRLQLATLSGYSTTGTSQWHVVNEEPSAVDILEIRRGVLDPRVAAFVDGDNVHRFQAHPHNGYEG